MANFWYAFERRNANDQSADNFVNRESGYFLPTPVDASVVSMPDLRLYAEAGGLGIFSVAVQVPIVFEAVTEGNESERPYSHSSSIQWQKKFFDFWKPVLGVQVGTGLMAHNPGCASTDGLSDCVDTTAKSKHLGFRAYTTGYFDFARLLDFFKLSYVAVFETVNNEDRLFSIDAANILISTYDENAIHNDEIPDGIYRGDHTWMSFGLSPHFILTDSLSIILLYGVNISGSPEPIKSEGLDNFLPDAKYVNEQRVLHHASLALQLSGDAQNIFYRTALRIFVSFFSWNEDWNGYVARRPSGFGTRYAREKHPLGRVPNSPEGGTTTAIIFGAQGETAF